MTIDRMILIIAGTFIVASVLLSHFHHPYWLFFTLFIGVNLAQAGVTKWCLMASILKMLGARPGTTYR